MRADKHWRKTDSSRQQTLFGALSLGSSLGLGITRKIQRPDGISSSDFVGKSGARLVQDYGEVPLCRRSSIDFRGERERTLPPKGRTLADSNQRSGKGFSPTYAFTRDYGGLVGRFKLDWIFVKPFIEDPRRMEQSYRFAPHFPVTMRELNESVTDRISDHPPMTVDLPLAEPTKLIVESPP